jgi:hypothetical protein
MKQGKSLSILKSFLILLIIFIPILILNSCSDNPEEFSMGKEYLESQANMKLIDTFTVNISTVLLDSVEASASGNAIVGIYNDNMLGTINCSSYFRLEIPEDYDAEKNDVYDSLYLILSYNNYFFGDTTKTQKLTVHQLTENITTDDDEYLSSHSTFGYNSTPIGSKTYTPRPNGEVDTLAIKLSDDIGKDLLAKLIASSAVITDTTEFYNYFHGLMIKADESYPGCVVGFAADEGNIRMILYSHRVYEEDNVDITHEFSLSATEKQFNNIKHDFSSTSLSSLKEQRYKLPSSSTGALSFLQGGIGLAIRVDLPSLSSLLMYDRGKIADAKLQIAPLTGTYASSADLPDNLIMYKTDKVNRRNSLVTKSSGSTVLSSLTIDNIYHENTYLQFDLTYFITSELEDSYVNPEDGLLITLYPTDNSSTLYRLIADAGNKNTKLKIYYLSY